MKTHHFIFLVFILLITVFLTFRISHSYFSDSGTSSDNILAASDTFPTATPTNTPTPTVTQTPTPTPQLVNHVVISEVQLHGGNANQDFIELYNPKNTSEDLSGWQLRRKDAAGNDNSLVLIPSGKSIPAHGFFLWANEQGNYHTTIGAEVFNSNNIGENNSLKLEDASDNLIDQVGWGSVAGHYVEGTPYGTSPGAGQSIERKAYSSSTTSTMSTGGSDVSKGNAFDSGDNSSDFITRTSQPQNTSSSTETP